MGNCIIKTFAPVAIPTLCRYEHLKKCIESLSRCTWANETELFIAIDYPCKDNHWDGYNKILQYIKHVDELGFKRVEIIKRKTNCGIGHINSNSALLANYLKTKYDRWIFTEDDNVFSPNFLDYMNKALELYMDDERVIAICGYNFPIDMGDYDKTTYLTPYYTAWGVGIWKDKRIAKDIDGIKKLLNNKRGVLHLLYHKPFYLYKILQMLENGKILGDYFHVAYCMINGNFNLLPKTSLVRNIGQDGTGLHSTSQYRDVYTNQIIDNATEFNISNVEVEEINAFRIISSISFYRWLILLKKLVKYYLGL